MRLRGLCLALVASALLCARCSLLTDTDGLSGGAAPRGDAGGADGSVGADAAGDAGAEGGGGDAAARGCARFPDAGFCVDFEGTAPLADGIWNDSDVGSPYGDISVTSTASVSPPNAALFDLRSLADAGPCTDLQLRRTFTGTYSSVSAHTSARIDAYGRFFAFAFSTSSTGYRALVSFEAAGDSNKSMVFVLLQKNVGGTFSDYGSATQALATSPLGAFHDVWIEYTARTPTVTVRVDDVTIPVTADGPMPIDTPRVYVGPYCRTQPFKVLADDVAVTLRP